MSDVEDKKSIAVSLEAKRDVLLRELARLKELMTGMREREREIQRALQDCLSAARVFAIDLEMPAGAVPAQGGHLKEWVVAALAQSGAGGVKAGALRTQYEAQTGRTIHPKTMGMTLYRMLKQGAVTRAGHVWFPASQH